MKNLIAFLMLGSIVFFSACSDDDITEPEVDSLVGLYQLSNATLTSDILGPDSEVVVPSGTDITAGVSAALLAAAPCTDPANTRVELEDGGSLIYTCVNEGTSEANGVWSIDDERTQLNLTINTPDSPVPVPLNLAGLVESTTGVEGTVAGLPLPLEVFGLTSDQVLGGLPIATVEVFIRFSKDQ